MKRIIYNLLIPKAIRNSIYRVNAQQVEDAEIARIRTIEGSLPPAELSAVYIANLQVLPDRHAFLNAMPKNAVVGEVGVRNGEFSDKILTITRPKALHLFGALSIEEGVSDIIEGQMKGIANKFHAEIQTGQVILQHGKPLIELERFSQGYFDWIYIDAGHSFEWVTNMLDICLRKVKQNGIIAGSNYSAGSVLYRKRYSLVEAVNTFCKKNGCEMIYLTNECHRNLSYAVRRMEF